MQNRLDLRRFRTTDVFLVTLCRQNHDIFHHMTISRVAFGDKGENSINHASLHH